MSLFQTFVDEDIQAIYDNACYGKNEIKDRYLISQLSYLSLSLTEHNLLKIHNLISETGVVYRQWALPASYTRNNKERVIEVPEVHCQAIEQYLDWYVVQDLPSEYRHSLNTYKGLSCKAPALLNDRLTEYSMSERLIKNGINKQPTNLRTKVNKILMKAGLDWATPKTFYDSLIINLGRGNADINQIVNAFGLSSRQVVLNKMNGNIINLGDALNRVYSRIKFTGH
ncbi:MAG: hypothetical protein COB35_12710 [Gammaproteobacteria bacterium]|nr:MAG: hypothetical protein COB35_12710 [Gammaproteobacteria bacterium]